MMIIRIFYYFYSTNLKAFIAVPPGYDKNEWLAMNSKF